MKTPIKISFIEIKYRGEGFTELVYIDNTNSTKTIIETKICEIVNKISRVTKIPKYLINKSINKKIGSICVSIITINDVNNLINDVYINNYEIFKSQSFCNNENLASYIVEVFVNKLLPSRYLIFGGFTQQYASIRREVSDYNIHNKFYQPGDLVKVRGYKDTFIVGCNESGNINKYNFSNIYDLFSIDNERNSLFWENSVKYDDIVDIVGNDVELLKKLISNKYRYVYTDEYYNEIINMGN